MKACIDCGTNIAHRGSRAKRCIACAHADHARRCLERARQQAAERAAAREAEREANTHRKCYETTADVEALLADVAARRRHNRMTLTVEDCWCGAGSMGGVTAGAES